MKDLKAKAISGAGWTFGSAVVLRLTQMLVTVVLAHLLMPKDFGLFALCFMIVNAINLFRDYGLAQSLIYQKGDCKGSADATFWMSVGFGVVAWLVIYVSAPLIAIVFAKPALVNPLRIMSLSVVISSPAMVPNALMEKNLMFRRRAVPEIANGIVYALVSIYLAYQGSEVWSLVWGHLAGVIAWSAGAWAVAGWYPRFSFHRDSACKSLSYGSHLMIASLLIFAFFYIDHAAIGRLLGVTALGLYSLAFTTCNLPATNITHVVNKVMFPTYTKLNHDREAMANAYLSTIRSISVLSFPLAFGFYAFAHDYVPVIFGPKWVDAVPLFEILAFYGLFRSIGATSGSVFMATGQPHWVLRANIVMVLIALAGLYPVTVNYGTVGVAVLFAGSYMIGMFITMYKVMDILDIRLADYTPRFKCPFFFSVISIGLALFVSGFYKPGVAHVVVTTVVSIITYAGLVISLDKSTTSVARDIVGSLSRKNVEVAETVEV